MSRLLFFIDSNQRDFMGKILADLLGEGWGAESFSPYYTELPPIGLPDLEPAGWNFDAGGLSEEFLKRAAREPDAWYFDAGGLSEEVFELLKLAAEENKDFCRSYEVKQIEEEADFESKEEKKDKEKVDKDYPKKSMPERAFARFEASKSGEEAP